MIKFRNALSYIFFVEGGYSNNPKDKGGETKYGITEGTYKIWIESKDAPEELPPLKGIDKGIAELIYKTMYWDAIRGDELPSGLSTMVFDSAVHAGPARAIRWLQRAVGEKMDGLIGPKTLDAVHTVSAKGSEFVNKMVREIAVYRLMLARKNDTFARGWFNRIVYILTVSL